MKNEMVFWLMGCALILILLTSCSGASTARSESAPTTTPTNTLVPPTDTPVPATETPVPPTDTPIPPTKTPTPLPEIDLNMEILDGDPLRGQNDALRYRCYGCHVMNPDGLLFESTEELPSIMERGKLRIADPAYNGKATTNQEYIIESIFLPEVYVLPGEWEEPMPTTFHYRITEKELGNIMAWLNTFE